MSHGDDPSDPQRAAIGALLLLIVAAGVYLLPRRTPLPAITKPNPTVATAMKPPAARAEPPSATKPIETVTKSSGVALEFCGLGKVTVDADDQLAAYRYLEGETHEAAQQWLSALLKSDDTRARAAGLILEGKIGQENLTGSPMQEQSRDELVALAVGAGDPALYAMALATCGAYSTPLGGACQQLSPAEWARLDPDNAMPWMVLAGKAQARNDAKAASDYFGRAARAKRMDAYIDTLFPFSEQEMPNDISALDRWYLTVGTVGVGAAMVLSFSPALRHCSGAALQDEQVRAQCGAVAELMVSGSPTLLEFSLGVSLGTRTGWSPTRVRELTEQRDAWMQVSMSDADIEAKVDWSCAAVEKNNAQMRRRAQLGELGALREQVEASDKTVSELAQKHRAWLENMQQRSARDAQAEQEESAPAP
jgi:hypothetical protein